MKDGLNASSHSVSVCHCSQDPRRRKNRPEICLTEFITLAIMFLYFFATALTWAIWVFSSFVASMTVAAMGYVWLTTATITRLPGAGPLMNRGGTVSMCILFAVCYGMGIVISTLGKCTIMSLVHRTHCTLSRLALKSRSIGSRSSSRYSVIRMDHGQ